MLLVFNNLLYIYLISVQFLMYCIVQFERNKVMLCYVMLCYVMLCYVMSCYVMLCYVMLCYVMLCYVMLFRPIQDTRNIDNV